MSKTTKVILIILGIIMLCCCVLGFLAITKGVSLLSSFYVSDPAEIQQVSDEIATFDLPVGYKADLAMNVMGIKTLFITGQSRTSMIMMVELNESMSGSIDTFKQSFQNSMIQQFGSGTITLNLVDTRTVQIKGQDATVQVYQGTDSSGNSYVEWSTLFDGNNGVVIVMMLGSADTWDDATMEAFLNSIH